MEFRGTLRAGGAGAVGLLEFTSLGGGGGGACGCICASSASSVPTPHVSVPVPASAPSYKYAPHTCSSASGPTPVPPFPSARPATSSAASVPSSSAASSTCVPSSAPAYNSAPSSSAPSSYPSTSATAPSSAHAPFPSPDPAPSPSTWSKSTSPPPSPAPSSWSLSCLWPTCLTPRPRLLTPWLIAVLPFFYRARVSDSPSRSVCSGFPSSRAVRCGNKSESHDSPHVHASECMRRERRQRKESAPWHRPTPVAHVNGLAHIVSLLEAPLSSLPGSHASRCSGFGPNSRSEASSRLRPSQASSHSPDPPTILSIQNVTQQHAQLLAEYADWLEGSTYLEGENYLDGGGCSAGRTWFLTAYADWLEGVSRAKSGAEGTDWERNEEGFHEGAYGGAVEWKKEWNKRTQAWDEATHESALAAHRAEIFWARWEAACYASGSGGGMARDGGGAAGCQSSVCECGGGNRGGEGRMQRWVICVRL
ncbi:hypothetical protein JB92DRAFT_1106686 [Gautieria morchelliformis]|nr:hypothetical protein JB92DRAFT_1106686 [Gautieria morchelliformis]